MATEVAILLHCVSSHCMHLRRMDRRLWLRVASKVALASIYEAAAMQGMNYFFLQSRFLKAELVLPHLDVGFSISGEDDLSRS